MELSEALTGDHAIDPELYYLLRMILPEGKTILELGSGTGTQVLLKHWNVISVEDDESYVNRYHHNYIFARLKPHKAVRNHDGENRWYDPEIMKREIPKLDYDFLLIDGPAAATRAGVVKYWDLFRQDVPIIVDDVHRGRDHKIVISLSTKLKRPFCTYNAWNVEEDGGQTHFAFIPGPEDQIPSRITGD